jgi:hypothetical protein
LLDRFRRELVVFRTVEQDFDRRQAVAIRMTSLRKCFACKIDIVRNE